MPYVLFMPKDFIHFAIADRTAKLLGDSPFGRDAKKHDATLLVGSIFHDVWFYMTGRSSGRLQELGDQLHGKEGEDTYWLLRKQAEIAKTRTAEGNGSTACSLLAGMVSHLCADVLMHPMIYHFTGNYYKHPKAVERHRRLESLLDMAADRLGDELRSTQIQHMLKAADLEGSYPADALAKKGEVTPATLHQELGEAFIIMSHVQRHIQKSTQGRLAHMLRAIVPQSMRDFFALFYAPQLKRYLPLVQETIKYQHPVTGEHLENTLDGFMNQAAQNAADMLRSLEDYVYNDATSTLPDLGPSLDTGLPGVSTDETVYFAPQPLPPL